MEFASTLVEMTMNFGFLKLAAVSFGAIWVYKKTKGMWSSSKRIFTNEEVETKIQQEIERAGNKVNSDLFESEKENLKKKGFNSPGVYIFSNLKNGKKYVGQSVNILNRVSTHLKGRGSSGLNLDRINGDKFTIQLIKLEGSQFSTLNSLEKHYIKEMESYKKGYNKTRGNN